MTLKDDVVIQAMMATPPTSVATMTILGVTFSDVVLIGTGVLLLLQIGYLLHKWIRMARSKEDACRSDQD
jgi:hypothetical protein